MLLRLPVPCNCARKSVFYSHSIATMAVSFAVSTRHTKGTETQTDTARRHIRRAYRAAKIILQTSRKEGKQRGKVLPCFPSFPVFRKGRKTGKEGFKLL